MEKGDRLIAKNECIMEDTNLPALTIGKEYEITGFLKEDHNYIEIINDDGEEHYFPISEIDEFFETIN